MSVKESTDVYAGAAEAGAQGFEALMRRAQRAYVERDIETYMGAWLPEYKSFSLSGDFSEDLADLRVKLEREFEKYSEVKMDFSIKKLEVAGDTGIAVLNYESELAGKGLRVKDRRENMIIGRFDGEKWRLLSKIIIWHETKSEKY